MQICRRADLSMYYHRHTVKNIILIPRSTITQAFLGLDYLNTTLDAVNSTVYIVQNFSSSTNGPLAICINSLAYSIPPKAVVMSSVMGCMRDFLVVLYFHTINWGDLVGA